MRPSHARGSAPRLFLLIYCGRHGGHDLPVERCHRGRADARGRRGGRNRQAKQPLPYLLICAFIANAASFVLPISNPANLVIYGSLMPPLLRWLPSYLLPSALSILATYLALRWTQRNALKQEIAKDIARPALSWSGKIAAIGIAATALALLACSTLDLQLGLPTAIAGAVTATAVLISERKGPWSALRNIAWGVLPLVAGLFVLVEALNATGLIAAIVAFLHDGVTRSASLAAWGAGIAVALVSNLINNLPAGLIAGSAVQAAHAPGGRHPRRAHRRRHRAEPFGDRLAGHHSLAHGLAP